MASDNVRLLGRFPDAPVQYACGDREAAAGGATVVDFEECATNVTMDKVVLKGRPINLDSDNARAWISR